MFTSYFANLKNVPPGFRPVAISQGIPKTYTGAREICLAPTWAMLKLPEEEYAKKYAAILRKLDPAKLYEQLGERAVLLCWETPNKLCHRRAAAEWFEKRLGIVVPELGLPRAMAMPFWDRYRDRKPQQQGLF